ncbi:MULTISPECIES: hypothetical protein [Actinosynnema]|uniref:Chemotaxis phosphatase CheX-like domain-containing protein n=3 Tax=Actinosynnema TaxID=40566 RepID=C6WJN1_ACTMD|nr:MULTISPECIES: hypothetical protein [Actinosynnema]AXX29708.1 hypothetical protein APASM_2343 [Actinosynnema pretiosum subsp. pretiosum]ACU36256.1 hypothetical protein Amir_2316 [Actinosynnema mirum DSM 43827]ATE53891.1 hypothetical protein CNX65_11785 [Actinosynnema pretiosum]MCP2099498.1 hypothetical protein [Actinosynnema pretiosum]QUF06069.1 hypothetical protein KCV87_08430 [Actinosynnema pretiosum subsp. pretiosum]
MADTLPAPKEIRDLLTDLIGKDVSVQLADPPGKVDKPAVAVFVHDDMSIAGVIGMEFPLAADLAAAVGLIPPGGAQAALEDGELSPMLTDNLAEICNVLTGLLNRDGGPHVKLSSIHAPGEEVPGDVLGYLQALGNRLDLDVAVTGYSHGLFSLVGGR